MVLSAITLVFLSIALAWTVLSKGGVYPSDLFFTLFAVGAISLSYWAIERKRPAPALGIWLNLAIIAFPLYLIFQLIPIPIGVLHLLSPARAALATRLAPVLGAASFAPLSSAPVQTVAWLFAVLGFIGTFLLIRQLAWRWKTHPWVVLIPLLAISTVESLIGISQALSNLATGTVTGTYTNHDHFAGSLEMTLPIAVLYGAAIFRNGRKPGGSPLVSNLLACLVWALAGLFLVAVSYSLSRMGFITSISVLLAIAALSLSFYLRSNRRLFLTLGGLVLAGLLIVVALPSRQLVERFTLFVPENNKAAELRPYLWRDTLPLIAEFPLFGCGFGGFESNFMKFQTAGKGWDIEFAHNDYLDYLADLGVVGFAIMLVILFGTGRQILLGLSPQPDESRRFMQIACSGSMLAILLHSLVDFNMHIPANAMTLAWIAGAGSSVPGQRHNNPKI